MRYFVYCRKSSDREDRQILGPEAQRRLLLEHATRLRLTVVDVYVEHQTAYKAGRPLFNEMLARLEKGDADGVLTYHLTRLARNSFDGGRVIYMMDEGTIRQIATPEKTYTDTADDKFMMQIHFAMAKKSSDDTSQFVTRDIESKLLRGEYPGMVPPGYLNINRDGHITKAHDDADKYMLLLKLDRPLRREEIDPIDGPIVRRLFEEAARGVFALPQLRQRSYALGLRAAKTGKMLSKNAIANLLTNPYYYGVIEYGGRIYDDVLIQERTGDGRRSVQHEPIITKDLFDRVQVALGRRGKGRYRKHVFAFGGCVLSCGECGGPITAERQRGHVYYHCTRTKRGCSQARWTREESVEEQLSGILRRLRLPQQYVDYALSRLRQVHADESQVLEVRRRKLQGQVNACQQRLDALLQMKISPGNADGSMLSDEEYVRQKNVIRTEYDVVEAALRSVQQEGRAWVDDCERFFRFSQELASRFKTTSVIDRRILLQDICSNVALRDQIVAVAYREPFASLANFPLAGDDDWPPSERRERLRQAEKPENVEKWLGILTAIRTYALPTSALAV